MATGRLSPEQLTQLREALAGRAQSYMDGSVVKLQSQLAAYLRAWLSDRLKVNNDTQITYSVSNQRLIAQLPNVVARFMGTKGAPLIRYIVQQIEEIFGLNLQYFSAIGRALPREERALRILMLQYGYDVGARKIIPGGWLEQLFQAQPVAQGVANSMQNAIAAKSTPRQFYSNLFGQLLGTNKLGWLSQHFDRFARDLFIEADRELQNQAADDMQLNYAVYSGTLKDNSRCFCRQRVGQVFTREVIRSWNTSSWKGKKAGTDVLVSAGGYQCRHSYSWLSDPLAARYIEDRGLNQYNNVACDPRRS